MFGSWFAGARVSGKLAKISRRRILGLVALLPRGTSSADRDDLYSMKQRRLLAERRKYSADLKLFESKDNVSINSGA